MAGCLEKPIFIQTTKYDVAFIFRVQKKYPILKHEVTFINRGTDLHQK
jgi:hypothetical protein